MVEVTVGRASRGKQFKTLSAVFFAQPEIEDVVVKFNNLKITSKLLILVGVTMIGLCVAGVLAAYMVKREMLAERIEQLKAMTEVGRNVALSLQKQVELVS